MVDALKPRLPDHINKLADDLISDEEYNKQKAKEFVENNQVLIGLFGEPKLVPPRDPLLREVLPKFDFENPPVDPIEFAKFMALSMLGLGGIGLASNQIGFRHRCFAVKSNPIMVFYNPEVIESSVATVVLEEACLSFPQIVVKVKRPRTIKLRYTLPNGEIKTDNFTDLTSRIIQHEISHLNGEIFSSNLSKLQKSIAIAHSNKNGCKYVLADLL